MMLIEQAIIGRLPKLILVTLFAYLLWGGSAVASPAVDAGSITGPQAATALVISQPDGTNDIVAEGQDFATTVLGNPWDMDAITDIYNERTAGINSTAGSNRMVINNGILEGTSAADPRFYLLYPGYKNDAIPSPGVYGINTPIDASKYTQLSFRMYLSAVGASDGGQVIWYRDSWLNATGHSWGASNLFTLVQGWHVYTLDLPTLGHVAGDIDWSGLIQGLRLDPTSASGVEIKIDWVRLTDPDGASSAYGITYTNTGGATFYADTDTNWANGYTSVIGEATTARQAEDVAATYSWNTANLPPGQYYVAGRASDDYASTVFNDAWDMAQSSDVAFTSANIANPSFSNGIFSFSTTGGDPYFHPRYSEDKSIDASQYTRLTFRMNASQNSLWIPIWINVNGTVHTFSGGFQGVTPGMKIYTVDLSTDPNWTGQVRRIQLKPVTAANIDVQIDWVALTKGSTPASESDLAGAPVYSPGPLTVRNAPIVRLTQPSYRSGEDYATATFGDPWDFNSLSDADRLMGLNNARIVNGVLEATTKGDGDPYLIMRTGLNASLDTNTPINASKYRYATFRYKNDGVDGRQDTVLGWVARYLWWDQGTEEKGETRDLVFNEGWNEYTVDLATVNLEAGSFAWSGNQQVFRFEPDEIKNPVKLYIDYILLTAMDQATIGSTFDIKWAGSYANGAVIDLYYDTDRDPTTKSPIVSGVAANPGVHRWTVSGVPAGIYTIYLVARDGKNMVGRYSESPVQVTVDSALLTQKVYLPVVIK